MTFSGFNDVFLLIKFLKHGFYRVIDSSYLRIDREKDIYEYLYTIKFLASNKNNLEYYFKKITQNYV